MPSLLPIALATVVLFACIVLLMRELRKAKSGAAQSSKSPAGPPSACRSLDDDENDVTRVGALPTLVDDDGETELLFTESKPVTLYENEQAHVDEPTGEHDLVLLHAIGTTDPGKKRHRNEDHYLVLPEQGLYLVADGMGGYAGGDVASKLAVAKIEEMFARGTLAPVTPDPKRPRRANELVSAIDAANQAIFEQARTSSEYTGMGTTVVAARFSVRKQRLYVGHVGDSRCYRLRSGHLKQMTTDHTLANQGVTGPLGSNIRRALGIHSTVKVDIVVDVPVPGDVYVVCSDGLTKMVPDDRIRVILECGQPLDRCASQLVEAANAAGGRDNVTVVLVNVRAPEDAPPRRLRSRSDSSPESSRRAGMRGAMVRHDGTLVAG